MILRSKGSYTTQEDTIIKLRALLAAMVAMVSVVPQDTSAWTTIAKWDPHPNDNKVYLDNKGGYLYQIDAWLAKVNSADQLAVIKGRCFSSCSFLLGAKNVCVYPSASIHFHGIHREGSTIVFTEDNNRYIATFPPKIQQWVMKYHAMDSIQHVVMTGTTAIDLGIPDCSVVLK